eukprot:CAMPEP_0177731538 /NCGR_PEP_ID=MMETSP0484_2-20121128/22611_1 /TAXON_ID=354590 /ORGANISM="Rhodomonas lens, Strain RHODO" /LENGTH=312 /DNA_ID=CAMNT_0019244671 /DNA_START=138 /DNA_END=1072 /DNA_ORIENTATION=-
MAAVKQQVKATVKKFDFFGLTAGGDKQRPGEQFGCELGIDMGSTKVYVAQMVNGGPAALCGDIAVGDQVLAIDGRELDSNGSSGGVKLGQLVDGEKGQPIWLKMQRAKAADGESEPEKYNVRLLRQDPLADSWTWSGAPEIVWNAVPDLANKTVKSVGGLIPGAPKITGEGVGLDLKKGSAGEICVKSIAPGGSAWLRMHPPPLEGEPALFAVDDQILEVDGVSMAKKSLFEVDSLLHGHPYTRVHLKLRRGEGVMEVDLLRAPQLPAPKLPNAQKYKAEIAACPEIPPLERTNRREGTRVLFAPKIAGLVP